MCLVLQVVGHLFAYTVAYDLVAENEEEKQEVSNLVDEVVGKQVERPSQLHMMCLYMSLFPPLLTLLSPSLPVPPLPLPPHPSLPVPPFFHSPHHSPLCHRLHQEQWVLLN